MERLRARNEWKFAGVLLRADRGLASTWWTLLILRGLLPALFALAMGALVGAVERQSHSRRSWQLWEWCLCSCRCCRRFTRRSAPIWEAGRRRGFTTGSPPHVSRPPGMGHLENPTLTSDLTMARDFDLGISGPPLSISMDFIAGGLVEMVGGLASAAGACGLRVVGSVTARRRMAGYALAVARERRLERSQYRRSTRSAAACRLHVPARGRAASRQRAAVVRARRLGHRTFPGAPAPAFRAALGSDAAARATGDLESSAGARGEHRGVLVAGRRARADGALTLGRLVTFASAAVSTSMIAFGGLSWALDGAAAPAAAVLRLQEAMNPAGALERGNRAAAGMPAREIRFRNVTFAYPTSS